MGGEVHVGAVVEGVPVEIVALIRFFLKRRDKHLANWLFYGVAFEQIESLVIIRWATLLCGDLRLFFLVVAPPCIDFRIPPSILLGFEPSCCLGLLKVAVFLLRNIQINIINSKREPHY